MQLSCRCDKHLKKNSMSSCKCTIVRRWVKQTSKKKGQKTKEQITVETALIKA